MLFHQHHAADGALAGGGHHDFSVHGTGIFYGRGAGSGGFGGFTAGHGQQSRTQKQRHHYGIHFVHSFKFRAFWFRRQLDGNCFIHRL